MWSLSDEANELFGYVIREGVTNVVRHAGARNCTIELDETGVAVIDDGRGMPPEPGGPSGHGLRGLRERAAELDAVLTVRSDRHGTQLAVHLEDDR